MPALQRTARSPQHHCARITLRGLARVGEPGPPPVPRSGSPVTSAGSPGIETEVLAVFARAAFRRRAMMGRVMGGCALVGARPRPMKNATRDVQLGRRGMFGSTAGCERRYATMALHVGIAQMIERSRRA